MYAFLLSSYLQNSLVYLYKFIGSQHHEAEVTLLQGIVCEVLFSF